MQKTLLERQIRHSEAGLSLIELMFACFVLAVGMLGALLMIMIAIQSNTRSKFDTTGTMIAQLVIEHINTIPTNELIPGTINPVTAIPVQDCNRPSPPALAPGNSPPTTWQIGVGAGGAQLNAQGNIDWTQPRAAVPANYIMLYYSCGDVVWETRWNVQQIGFLTKLITVSSRQSGTATAAPRTGWVFAPPVTLRTVSGP